jgi:ornithine cyclodeaminase/alanine dehydrogenase-like protein (mu-crystallin family)
VTGVRLLSAADVRALITPADALAAVRDAFVRLARGEASLPPILDLAFPGAGGEAHVKGAWLHGDPYWSVKAATGFYRNPELGLPVTSGLSLVFSAETGRLAAIVSDGGLLTELRTAAAGALAADLLARAEIDQVTVVGAGGQAAFQVEALLGVRRPRRIAVWARRPERALACAEMLAARHGLPVEPALDLEAAVRAADLVVTVTPSDEPLVRAGWLRAGAHLTAVGSDMPGKQEVEAAVLAAADVVVADHPPAAALHGELQHALAAGVLLLGDVIALGALAGGSATGRTDAAQITFCDLVGVGVQDAAVAGLVVGRALEVGAGTLLPV